MANHSSSLKLNLSTHTDKYAADSRELIVSKKVSFIFGKNGTGKTTIADELVSQFSDNYSVHVFQDFDGVAVNERLDAVALGAENVKIQKKIDVIDGEIAIISKEVEIPEGDAKNLFTKAASAKKALDEQQKKIEDFFIRSAQQIKNQSNPNIASTSYDKNGFKSDIGKAKMLTEEEVASNIDTIKADKKPDIALVTLPVIGLSAYLESINKVLGSCVKQPSTIPELNNSTDKQQFAKSGMDVHEHTQGEVCAFCGNEISEARWAALGNYFNSEVKTLELRIATEITKIQEDIKRLDSIRDIDLHAYYGKYSKQIKQLNSSIKLRKTDHKTYLEKLERALVQKKTNLFAKTNPIKLATPEDFGNIQKEYAELIENNNLFSRDLASEQNKSKDALRYHDIHKRLESFKYTEESTALATLSGQYDATQDNLNSKKGKLAKKQEERTNLISQTKDEKKIAIKINGLLKNMGVASFELDLVEDEDENQKGQYQIKGHNGKLRQITALSKGEKNIIAFLYFIFNLERTDGGNKPKIIVLDDPMTSNDDTMQYIMIGEIQKFYRALKADDYFILLTHNVHFYLNVRPNTAIKYKVDGKEVSFYEKFDIHHLLSDGMHTTILSIAKGKNDFRTSYETLWKELVFLHGATDATPDLMLNPCRKICETYMSFTKKGIEAFYGENINAKKLFDVNQHSVDDLEAEQNGKTKDEIRDILKGLFMQNEAEEHFNSYWKEN